MQNSSEETNPGNLIREARRRLGFTQFAVAKTLGLSSGQSISNIERDATQLPRKYIRPICELLQIEKTKLINAVLNSQRIRLLGA